MTYIVAESQVGARPGETIVEVDDHTVAVAVKPTWLSNGAGIAIMGTARWIDCDGATHTCPQGQHVELTFSHTADAASVARYGLQALCREVLLLMLGEEPSMTDHDNEDGSTHSAPIIAWGDAVRLNTSVRHAIACVGSVASISAESVLGRSG